jgi:hypothetical protein
MEDKELTLEEKQNFIAEWTKSFVESQVEPNWEAQMLLSENLWELV